MTIKQALAITVFVLGIWANLEFQGAIAAAQGAAAEWELRQLHQPSAMLLAREHDGSVTIFDGLPNREVEQALDTQFDRMGSMMFIRTQYVQDDGSIDTDNDCD